MTFKNAYSGVKKLFTSQLLSLISAVVLIIAAIVGAASAVTGSQAGLAVTGVLGIAGLILPIIAYIFNLLGLRQASFDEGSFGTAFTIAVFVLLLSLVSFIFNVFRIGHPAIDDVINLIAQFGSIIVTYFTIQGIMNLAEKLHDNSVYEMGRKIVIIYIVIYGIASIVRLLPVFFTASQTLAVVGSVLTIIGSILSLVVFIIYLVYLGRAKEMLRVK